MSQNHDRHYKFLLSDARMVRRLLEGFVHEPFVETLDLTTLERVDGEFVDGEFSRRQSDVVWRAYLRGRPVYIFLLLEFQSTVDETMPLRFLRYVTGLYQSIKPQTLSGLLPAVFPILIYNGNRAWTAPKRFEDAVEDSIPSFYIPTFGYYAVILRSFKRENLARMRNALAAVFYVENTHRRDIDSHIDTIVDILKEEEPQLVDMFKSWFLSIARLREYGDGALRRITEAVEVKPVFAETVEEYEKELKEAARKEALEQTATRLLKRGMPRDEVCEITGLSAEDVEALERDK
jgi:predicted transposase/invertase (TIGR01784 family)